MTMHECTGLTAVVISNNRWTVPRHGGIDCLHTTRGLKLCDDLSDSLQKKPRTSRTCCFEVSKKIK